MSAGCSRAWQAQAARDGRFDAQLCAAYQQHCTACDACAREQRYIDSLGSALRGCSTPPDEVTMRRLRLLVLQRAELARTGMPVLASRWPVSRLLFVLCLAAASGGVLVHYLQVSAAVKRHTPASVRPESVGAKWARRSSASVEQIDLTDGVLQFVVHRSPGDPRLVVRVPDGEIEDEGTTFRVTVRDGRTLEIGVSDGWVRFRRQGQLEVRLPAGSTWAPEVSAPVSQVEERAPQVKARIAPSAQGEARPTPRVLRGPRRRHGHGQQQTQSVSDPGIDEDQAYLELLELVRLGHYGAAGTAARDYLNRFPSAFRRAEVQTLAALP